MSFNFQIKPNKDDSEVSVVIATVCNEMPLPRRQIIGTKNKINLSSENVLLKL